MKMNKKQVAIMAAILGISNAGMDGVFLGNGGSGRDVTPEMVRRHYLGRDYGDLVESAVMTFGGGFFENEDMAKGFVDEAKSWVSRLRGKTTTEVKADHPRYAAFVDAISQPPF